MILEIVLGLIAYLILCAVVANIGRNKSIGYKKSFLVCLFFTPLVGIFIIIISPKNPKKISNNTSFKRMNDPNEGVSRGLRPMYTPHIKSSDDERRVEERLEKQKDPAYNRLMRRCLPDWRVYYKLEILEDELEKLYELKNEGIISVKEFIEEKSRILERYHVYIDRRGYKGLIYQKKNDVVEEIEDPESYEDVMSEIDRLRGFWLDLYEEIENELEKLYKRKKEGIISGKEFLVEQMKISDEQYSRT